MIRNILKMFVMFAWMLLPATAWSAEQPSPQVVVSIKPVHSLVAGIMAGAGSPMLLIKGGASPHGYALRPSEAHALNQARLIIWVGPELESFLEKSLGSIGKDAQQLRLAESMSNLLLPARAGGNWEEENDQSDHSHASHLEEGIDPHLWLGPAQAKRITELAVVALSEADPANRDLYRANGKKLQQRLEALQLELAEKLAPVVDVPYMVFHDAFQYFEHAFGLNVVGSVTLNPERGPGIRRILEIRNRIQQLGARCVFSEPQFEPRLIATVIEDTDAATGTLDPIGADLPEGADTYFLLMRNLADALSECLAEADNS